MNAPVPPHATGFNAAVVNAIKAEAAILDLSDAALAEAVGMHPTQMSRYLNFKRGLTLGTAERIAGALGLTYSDLVKRAAQREGE